MGSAIGRGADGERMAAGRVEAVREVDARLAAGRHIDRLFADGLVIDQELDGAIVSRLVAELAERGGERDFAAER